MKRQQGRNTHKTHQHRRTIKAPHQRLSLQTVTTTDKWQQPQLQGVRSGALRVVPGTRQNPPAIQKNIHQAKSPQQARATMPHRSMGARRHSNSTSRKIMHLCCAAPQHLPGPSRSHDSTCRDDSSKSCAAWCSPQMRHKAACFAQAPGPRVVLHMHAASPKHSSARVHNTLPSQRMPAVVSAVLSCSDVGSQQPNLQSCTTPLSSITAACARRQLR